MKNNIIRDGSKDGFQVMILKMKNIIEKANAKVAGNAAKRADGRASEFGMHQPKKPSKKQ